MTFLKPNRSFRPTLHAETLALLLSLWFTAVCNPLFWHAIFTERPLGQPGAWLFAGALAVLVTGLHFILLVLPLSRWTTKPLLTVLVLTTAFATYFMRKYYVYLDPEMLRNVLRTDTREASELFSADMLLPLLAYAALPLALIWRTGIPRVSLPKATLRRVLSLGAAVVAIVASGFLIFQDLSSMMREKKEIRYLLTPGNYLVSLARTVGADAGTAVHARAPVGTDAKLGGRWTQRKKPVLFVVFIGETARAANWGLSGYPRQTTPQLAGLDVINFTDVTACGPSTEVSLPCMFSHLGRNAYDEAKIRGSESLPDVLKHAGLRVLWLDNQSGCKGICDGIESWKPTAADFPKECKGSACLDEVLLGGMKKAVDGNQDNTVLILHQLGNHGPAYGKRYPPEFRRFTPDCQSSDLGRCTQEEIVNAYDNALLYTDHVLAQTIAYLKSKQATHDTALIYVSDHGESLGENGLYLHGVPYAIAPDVQKKVPMLLWLSPGFAASSGLRAECLRERAKRPASHDNLYHSTLGFLDVETAVRNPAFDLTRECRS